MADRLPVLALRIGKEISQVYGRDTRNELLRDADLPNLRVNIGLETIILDLENWLDITMPFDYLLQLNEPLNRELRWQQIYRQNALSAMYFAFDPEKSADDNPPYHQALAVIEAMSQIGTTTDPEKLAIRKSSLDISGIAKDSAAGQHIVSVRYDLYEGGEASQSSVSVPTSYHVDWGYTGSSVPVDDMIPDELYIYGFSPIYPVITQQMKNEIGHEDFVEATPLRSGDSKAFGIRPRFSDKTFHEVLIEAGSPGTRILGLNREIWTESGLVPTYEWIVQYPNSVAKN